MSDFFKIKRKTNMTREMNQSKDRIFIQKNYGEINAELNFSKYGIDWFKARYHIKPYQRFDESGSATMQNIEDALIEIRAKLNQFSQKDIYNMDKIVLFYPMASKPFACYKAIGRKQEEQGENYYSCLLQWR